MKHIHFHLDIRTQNLQSGFKSVERSIAVEVEDHHGKLNFLIIMCCVNIMPLVIKNPNVTFQRPMGNVSCGRDYCQPWRCNYNLKSCVENVFEHLPKSDIKFNPEFVTFHNFYIIIMFSFPKKNYNNCNTNLFTR